MAEQWESSRISAQRTLRSPLRGRNHLSSFAATHFTNWPPAEASVENRPSPLSNRKPPKRGSIPFTRSSSNPLVDQLVAEVGFGQCPKSVTNFPAGSSSSGFRFSPLIGRGRCLVTSRFPLRSGHFLTHRRHAGYRGCATRFPQHP